jgi:hypothetical protein
LGRLIEQQERVGVVSKTAQTTALAELASFVERKESLEDMLPVILETLDIKVVLDDGTLVGKLAPEIDRNLALLRRRGLVGV